MSDLLTLNDTKLILDVTDPTEQKLIKLLISAVSISIEKYCNRIFIQANYEEIQDGDGTLDILVKNPPIGSVTEITEDDIVVSSDWYVIYADEGCIKRKDSGAWAKGIQNIVIKYSGGWSQADLPKDLKWACLQWVHLMWKRKEDQRVGVSSWNFGDQSVSFITEEIPTQIKPVLDRYRILGMG